MVWMNFVTVPFPSGLLRLGVLVDEGTGDVLVCELVTGALDLRQVDRLVGPVVAGRPRQRHAEAGVEVREAVGGVLHPLAGDLEAERLQDVAEDRGADVAGLGPGR